MEQAIMEKQSEKQMSQLEGMACGDSMFVLCMFDTHVLPDEASLHRKKTATDAEVYRLQKTAEANAVRCTICPMCFMRCDCARSRMLASCLQADVVVTCRSLCSRPSISSWL